jgi:hypothetical protein
MDMIGLGIETPLGVAAVTKADIEDIVDGYIIKFIEFAYQTMDEQYKRFISFVQNRPEPLIIKCTNIYKTRCKYAQYPLTLEFIELMIANGFTKSGDSIQTNDLFDKKYVNGFIVFDEKSKRFHYSFQ